VLNNPIKYNDLDGHDSDCGLGEGECKEKVKQEKRIEYLDNERKRCASEGGKDCPDYVGMASTFVGVVSASTLAAGAIEAGLSTVVKAATALIPASGLLNKACAGDCSDEIENTSNLVDESIPQFENVAGQYTDDAVKIAKQTLNNLIENGEVTKRTTSELIIRKPQNASYALDVFGKSINEEFVSANENLTRFWANSPLGGRVDFRPQSGISPLFPSTPVIEFNNIPGYLDHIKIHFWGQ
jgi:hypothetical protein